MILGENWVCERCGNRIRLFVQVLEPPVCANSQKHSTTPVQMTKETQDD